MVIVARYGHGVSALYCSVWSWKEISIVLSNDIVDDERPSRRVRQPTFMVLSIPNNVSKHNFLDLSHINLSTSGIQPSITNQSSTSSTTKVQQSNEVDP